MFETNETLRQFLTGLFLTGLALGWGPCIVSCGVMLPYITGTKRGWWQGFRTMLIFSLGRLGAYIFLGGVAGFSGALISSLFYITKTKYYLQLYGGIFIFLLGLIIFISGVKDSRVCSFIHKWDQGNVFIAGLFVGLVPCAPLLAVLTYLILNTSNYMIGSLGGAVFGIGTILSPLLILGGTAGFIMKFIESERVYFSLRKISGALVMFLAVKTIISGYVMIRQ
ncbi:sulfite exporter TauE/SafE family protein [bacterium]